MEKNNHLQGLLATERENMRTLKAKLGIFSTFGVTETRQVFNERFARGKKFAQRQSWWDAIFLGIGAMGRDEGLIEYLFRLLINMLFNFTIGMIGAVTSFIYSLIGIIQGYNTSFAVALPFFLLGSLAAVSFAMSWLVGLYLAAAGTVYVSATLIDPNLRIEGGRGRGRQERVHYHRD